MSTVHVTWRKSRNSGGDGGNCVELGSTGLVRDSKNPAGAAIRVDLSRLLTAAKDGQFDRC